METTGVENGPTIETKQFTESINSNNKNESTQRL